MTIKLQCAACHAGWGLSAAVVQLLPLECPSCGHRGQGVVVETLPFQVEGVRCAEPAGPRPALAALAFNRSRQWPLVVLQSGEIVRVEQARDGDTERHCRLVPPAGHLFWEGGWGGSVRQNTADIQVARVVVPEEGTLCPLPEEGQWFQEVASGEVFTVVGGCWVWVTAEGAIPARLPLVPVLRRIH